MNFSMWVCNNIITICLQDIWFDKMMTFPEIRTEYSLLKHISNDSIPNLKGIFEDDNTRKYLPELYSLIDTNSSYNVERKLMKMGIEVHRDLVRLLCGILGLPAAGSHLGILLTARIVDDNLIGKLGRSFRINIGVTLERNRERESLYLPRIATR